MTRKTVRLADLNPAPYNPRKDLQPDDPEYQALAASVTYWGLVVPMVWNQRTGNLVGGHQRLKVLLAGGVQETEVTVVDLDLQEEQALNIALNRITGAWVFPALADVFRDLEVAGFDIALTGFSPEQVRAIIEGWDPPDDQKPPRVPDVVAIKVAGVRPSQKDQVVNLLKEVVRAQGFEFTVQAV